MEAIASRLYVTLHVRLILRATFSRITSAVMVRSPALLHERRGVAAWRRNFEADRSGRMAVAMMGSGKHPGSVASVSAWTSVRLQKLGFPKNLGAK